MKIVNVCKIHHIVKRRAYLFFLLFEIAFLRSSVENGRPNKEKI